FFFSSRRRHTRSKRDWSSDVCSSDLTGSVVHRTEPEGFHESLRGKERGTADSGGGSFDAQQSGALCGRRDQPVDHVPPRVSGGAFGDFGVDLSSYFQVALPEGLDQGPQTKKLLHASGEYDFLCEVDVEELRITAGGDDVQNRSVEPLAGESPDITGRVGETELLPVCDEESFSHQEELVDPQVAVGGCLRCHVLRRQQPKHTLVEFGVLLEQTPGLQFGVTQPVEHGDGDAHQKFLRRKQGSALVQLGGRFCLVQLAHEPPAAHGQFRVEPVLDHEVTGRLCLLQVLEDQNAVVDVVPDEGGGRVSAFRVVGQHALHVERTSHPFGNVGPVPEKALDEHALPCVRGADPDVVPTEPGLDLIPQEVSFPENLHEFLYFWNLIEIDRLRTIYRRFAFRLRSRRCEFHDHRIVRFPSFQSRGFES